MNKTAELVYINDLYTACRAVLRVKSGSYSLPPMAKLAVAMSPEAVLYGRMRKGMKLQAKIALLPPEEQEAAYNALPPEQQQLIATYQKYRDDPAFAAANAEMTARRNRSVVNNTTYGDNAFVNNGTFTGGNAKITQGNKDSHNLSNTGQIGAVVQDGTGNEASGVNNAGGGGFGGGFGMPFGGMPMNPMMMQQMMMMYGVPGMPGMGGAGGMVGMRMPGPDGKMYEFDGKAWVLVGGGSVSAEKGTKPTSPASSGDKLIEAGGQYFLQSADGSLKEITAEEAAAYKKHKVTTPPTGSPEGTTPPTGSPDGTTPPTGKPTGSPDGTTPPTGKPTGSPDGTVPPTGEPKKPITPEEAKIKADEAAAAAGGGTPPSGGGALVPYNAPKPPVPTGEAGPESVVGSTGDPLKDVDFAGIKQRADKINSMINKRERARHSGLGYGLGAVGAAGMGAAGYTMGDALAQSKGWDRNSWGSRLARWGGGLVGGLLGGVGGYYGGKALTRKRHMAGARSDAEAAYDREVAKKAAPKPEPTVPAPTGGA